MPPPPFSFRAPDAGAHTAAAFAPVSRADPAHARGPSVDTGGRAAALLVSRARRGRARGPSVDSGRAAALLGSRADPLTRVAAAPPPFQVRAPDAGARAVPLWIAAAPPPFSGRAPDAGAGVHSHRNARAARLALAGVAIELGVEDFGEFVFWLAIDNDCRGRLGYASGYLVWWVWLELRDVEDWMDETEIVREL
ncbi:hypothetical protein AURDEDRAFT_169745 [Auricularia subglabra TFB-10046 SS5]|nr:hypothetical protein AURDEDRAFT_169745 [Auricularia subglabra TFB-10046 SS5]